MTPNAARGRFVTLEQFIIDTFTRILPDGIEQPADRPDEIGGGGTYAILGARMFLPPSRLGMIVDHTPETLPGGMRRRLEDYGKDMFHFRLRDDGQPTARAVNRYKGEERGFAFLTQNKVITPLDLRDTPFAKQPPSTVHFISYPARIRDTLDELEEMRTRLGWEQWRPTLLWEPDLEALPELQSLTHHVDIISPNHTEAFRALRLKSQAEADMPALRAQVELACRTLASYGPRRAAIIRAGSQGCCYVVTSSTPEPAVKVVWVQPYWRPGHPESAGKVVDPTGAGNAFMGGLGAALEEGRDIHEAVLWGSVAASFVIEQDGLPVLSRTKDGLELWNGESPLGRVKHMQQR